MLGASLDWILAQLNALQGEIMLVAESLRLADPRQLVYYGLIALLWLGGAFAAAAAAEATKRPIFRHFFIGLLLPYGYAMYLMNHRPKNAETGIPVEQVIAERPRNEEMVRKFAASRAKVAAAAAASRAKAAGSVPDDEIPDVNEPDEPEPAEPVPAPAPETPGEPDDWQEDFARLLGDFPVAPDGSRRGPFTMMLANGTATDLDSVKPIPGGLLLCRTCEGRSIRMKIDNIATIEYKQHYNQE